MTGGTRATTEAARVSLASGYHLSGQRIEGAAEAYIHALIARVVGAAMGGAVLVIGQVRLTTHGHKARLVVQEAAAPVDPAESTVASAATGAAVLQAQGIRVGENRRIIQADRQ